MEYRFDRNLDGTFIKGTKPWNKGLVKSSDYRQLHKWIRRNYGSANHCQNIDCKHESKYFDWAKLPECSYEHGIENFIQLCRKCHKLMDVKGVEIRYVRI